ncbi:MAG TPA: hypothetical protein VGO90_00075 [Chthoniobacteraceae bacterium]|nr:hypothetical protein [Chthoniobacteraceae bacterium]
MKLQLALLSCLAVTFTAQAGPKPSADYVAHEWGTFTSVQGADGVQMEWNPGVVSDLPPFVYEISRVRSRNPLAALLKLDLRGRQRMETPVIYFYTDQPRSVDVAVSFPEGTITEWYPQEGAADVMPRTAQVKKTQPALRWKNVQLLPAGSSAAKALQLPIDAADSHYFAARETDAALVQTQEKGKTETEKFLFYRGVGSFQAPLTAKLEGVGGEVMHLSNTGAEALTALFVTEIRGAKGRVIPAGDLGGKAEGTISLAEHEELRPLDEVRAALSAQMQTALVKAGLYEREAAAMIKTWESAWFGENGLRVLYILPRSWTDRVLPLKLTPAPRETARVMVGRAEMITLEKENALAENVDRYIKADAAERAAIVGATRQLELGRFTEATLRRVIAREERDATFKGLAWELFQAASVPAVATTASR